MTATPADRVCLRDRLALRKLGNPKGFRFFRYEFIQPETTLMTGCIVTRTYQKGPKKGRPVYDGDQVMVCVTDAEIAAEERAYEAETGRCARCLGEQQEWAGWSAVAGHKYQRCSGCGGSGSASAAATP